MLDPSFLNNIFLIRLVHVEGVSDLNLSLDPQKTLYHCLVTSGHLNWPVLPTLTEIEGVNVDKNDLNGTVP